MPVRNTHFHIYLLLYNNEFLTDQYSSFKVLVDTKSVKIQNNARKHGIEKNVTYGLFWLNIRGY